MHPLDHQPPLWRVAILGLVLALVTVGLVWALASNLPAGTLARVLMRLGLAYGRAPVPPNVWE